MKQNACFLDPMAQQSPGFPFISLATISHRLQAHPSLLGHYGFELFKSLVLAFSSTTHLLPFSSQSSMGHINHIQTCECEDEP